uniref:EF-hand domain-containing protein n=1 Tax=Macrostomum lignano TaxID=282301 RepID=A0A1I8FA90_9PLAT
MPLFSAAHVHCESAKKTYDKDGLISFEEFETFEGLLSLPDHAYRELHFDLFDVNGNGYRIQIGHHGHHAASAISGLILIAILFDLHFGKARDQIVSYEEFTQLIHDFHEEHALQAFQRSDKRNEGKIRAMDLINIMVQLKSNLLTSVVFGAEHGSHISFSYFNAFISPAQQHGATLKKLIQARTGNDVHAAVTREELTNDAMSYNQLTPLEWTSCSNSPSFFREDDCISYYDVKRMAPFDEYTSKYAPGHRRPPGCRTLWRPGLRAAAGHSCCPYWSRCTASRWAPSRAAIGATAVYSHRLETRMQNQRTSTVGEVLYRATPGTASRKSSASRACSDSTEFPVTEEVDRGFIPAVRRRILAGAAAPAAPRQVIFTVNGPLEIVKIRPAGGGREIATQQRVSAPACGAWPDSGQDYFTPACVSTHSARSLREEGPGLLERLHGQTSHLARRTFSRRPERRPMLNQPGSHWRLQNCTLLLFDEFGESRFGLCLPKYKIAAGSGSG